MNQILEIYNSKCNKSGDINEHLPTLKKYAEQSETIVEMGVRYIVSTWAFLAGKPKKLISIDIKHPVEYGCNDLPLVEKYANENGIEFQFILSDVLKIEIPECDLLFIDTLHVYNQLKEELRLHADKAKKFIVFHDTTTFNTIGEVKGQVGIGPALEEFLSENPNWKIAEVFTNNNGLTIIKRK